MNTCKLRIAKHHLLALFATATITWVAFTLLYFFVPSTFDFIDSEKLIRDTNTPHKQLYPAENVINSFKGHLNSLRKELDISNTKEESSKDGTKSAVSTVSAGLVDAKIAEFVLRDKIFQATENIDLLLRAAHAIERKLNKAAPPVIHHSPPTLHLPSPTSTKLRFQLDPKVLDLLAAVVQKTAKNKNNKSKLKKQETLNLYEESKYELSPWGIFHNHISQHELYGENDPAVKDLLKDMTYLPIKDIELKDGGTQLKLLIYYADGDTIDMALWKPMRFTRDRETLPDHFYFTDFERHNAEIAAFHLDSILEFRRVPPTIGRRLNVTSDIRRYADKKLEKTFFTSPAGNVCFFGKCTYYCDSLHPVCGNPHMLEGSFAAFLPPVELAARKKWRHPWRRSYSRREKAEWETKAGYCANIKTTPPYDSYRRMLDLMDMAVFDFLTGNMDRHHYETFEDFGNNTFTLLMDNGRGFGKSSHDEMSILVPIKQCCLFRHSTLVKLMKFNKGPKTLSSEMRNSLASDQLNPVLNEAHLAALDRRVDIILQTVHDCITFNKKSNVVIDDGF